MRRPLLLQGILVVTLAGLAAACGDDDPTGPTPGPTPTPITESYTGTLTVNGAVTFAPIVVNQAGSANATIRALTPSALVKVHGGGTGEFSPGETVYQGESLDAATTTGVVHSWNPATGSLHVASVAAGTTFVADTPVIGATSGANWTSAGTSGTIVGLALGTWSGTTCTIVLANDISSIGGVVTGAVQDAGVLCARVYDVGRIEVPITFTIEVVHF